METETLGEGRGRCDVYALHIFSSKQETAYKKRKNINGFAFNCLKQIGSVFI